jgi:threonyl-tRNA synthetase
MNNQKSNIEYYVSNGSNEKLIKLSVYLSSDSCSQVFKQFACCEAYGKHKGGNSDYIEMANKLGFSWEASSRIGFMNYDYKANWMMEVIKEYARSLVHKIGFPIYEVRGANIFDMSHPVVASYGKLYGDRLFQLRVDDNENLMSYDASYPQFNLASKYHVRKEDLPFAHFSLSDCYRMEQSGECMLMYRLRRFFMPDLHPYFESVSQAFKWYPVIEKKLIKAAEAVNRKYQLIIEVGSPEFFEQYKSEIKKLSKNFGREVLIAVHNDDKPRYWIINADYKIVDKLGHSREICCIQIDVGNAKRLGIKYWDNGNERPPVIIHSAVPGGIERFLYMVIDSLPANFPYWLNPSQLRLIPVSKKFISAIEKSLSKLSEYSVRVEIDDRDESVSKKVRRARADLVHKFVVVGEKELKIGLDGYLQKIINKLQNQADSEFKAPFMDISWPRKVSSQLEVN